MGAPVLQWRRGRSASNLGGMLITTSVLATLICLSATPPHLTDVGHLDQCKCVWLFNAISDGVCRSRCLCGGTSGLDAFRRGVVSLSRVLFLFDHGCGLRPDLLSMFMSLWMARWSESLSPGGFMTPAPLGGFGLVTHDLSVVSRSWPG